MERETRRFAGVQNCLPFAFFASNFLIVREIAVTIFIVEIKTYIIIIMTFSWFRCYIFRNYVLLMHGRRQERKWPLLCRVSCTYSSANPNENVIIVPSFLSSARRFEIFIWDCMENKAKSYKSDNRNLIWVTYSEFLVHIERQLCESFITVFTTCGLPVFWTHLDWKALEKLHCVISLETQHQLFILETRIELSFAIEREICSCSKLDTITIRVT